MCNVHHKVFLVLDYLKEIQSTHMRFSNWTPCSDDEALEAAGNVLGVQGGEGGAVRHVPRPPHGAQVKPSYIIVFRIRITYF